MFLRFIKNKFLKNIKNLKLDCHVTYHIKESDINL